MLGATAVVVALCVVRVRKAALAQAVGGEAGPWWRRKRAPAAPAGATTGRLRRVRGSPVVWKETLFPTGRRRIMAIVWAIVPLAALVATYVILDRNNHALFDQGSHVAVLIIMMLIGIFVTTILTPTTIASEKEAGTWPLLLTTPLTNTRILLGKALGSLAKCAPIWLLLALHLAVAILILRCLHPLAALQLAIIVAGVVALLTGTGLYFSAVFRKTTVAVILNLVFCLGLWGILPLVAAMVEFPLRMALGSKGDMGLTEFIGDLNPMAHVALVADASAGLAHAQARMAALSYDWPSSHGSKADALTTTLWLLAIAAGYALLGLLFALRARARIRKNAV